MKNFNYKKICANLMKGLSLKTRDVIERRFGLNKKKEETLESIGKGYGLTRERIRQIEKEGLLKIRKRLEEERGVFQYFKEVLRSFGSIKREDIFFNFFIKENKEKDIQNIIAFLLSLANNDFTKFFQDKNFYSFWSENEEIGKKAKEVAEGILNFLKKENKLFTLEQLFEAQKENAQKVFGSDLDKTLFLSCLEISKGIGKSPEELYGLKSSVEINPKGIKNKAYLVFKKEKRPLHFTEVAKLIEKLPFSTERKPNLATVHNELIKDNRFVLIGRGLYALREWGYEPGFVKDIIYKVLKESERPLTKEEILKKVLKQRQVKENTILLNLQNKNFFLKNSEGKYNIKEG